MKKMLVFALVSYSCSAKPSNEIDALAEEVIKKREGISIQMVPIDPVKR
jgi:hypothetical protein